MNKMIAKGIDKFISKFVKCSIIHEIAESFRY